MNQRETHIWLMVTFRHYGHIGDEANYRQQLARLNDSDIQGKFEELKQEARQWMFACDIETFCTVIPNDPLHFRKAKEEGYSKWRAEQIASEVEQRGITYDPRRSDYEYPDGRLYWEWNRPASTNWPRWMRDEDMIPYKHWAEKNNMAWNEQVKDYITTDGKRWYQVIQTLENHA